MQPWLPTFGEPVGEGELVDSRVHVQRPLDHSVNNIVSLPSTMASVPVVLGLSPEASQAVFCQGRGKAVTWLYGGKRKYRILISS